ncbi:hypothetical protein EHO60_13800 [Leptospira fletcheri]|uniref:Uncharacterized protein n=1 Tax=Leptospira fletcheri TaxID=2484981 RepID=A0A4R9GA78_9LEPT|nr:hypothetical protein [Leptospira fletcheri]TGK08656.1 hypothetical protein EHO60_13800 [Leptospira fletcheri]
MSQPIIRIFLSFLLLGLSSFPISAQTDVQDRKDVPIGIIVYCSSSEKISQKDPIWERNLSLWYKAYKKKKQAEGGGAFLLGSFPISSANSEEERNRLRNAIGFDIMFDGASADLSPKKASNVKKAGSKKAVRRKKNRGDKNSGSKTEKPSTSVLGPTQAFARTEANLNFLFYSSSFSPSTDSLSVRKEFRSQLLKWIGEMENHFLLIQDFDPSSKEDPNQVAEELRSLRAQGIGSLPSVILLTRPRPLRFYEGEYTFGCGANPNSLRLVALELFFRNGKLIRIAEETYSLNSADSNKPWVLE